MQCTPSNKEPDDGYLRRLLSLNTNSVNDQVSIFFQRSMDVLYILKWRNVLVMTLRLLTFFVNDEIVVRRETSRNLGPSCSKLKSDGGWKAFIWMDLDHKNNDWGESTLWLWLGLEDSHLNGKCQVAVVFLCWLMVRISLQFNGFRRRFSKNEGWRYFCHVPNFYIRKFQNWPSLSPHWCWFFSFL